MLIWVREAKGIHLVDLKKYTIENNTVYCLSPGQLHLFHTTGPTEGYVISFAPDFINPGGDYFDLLYSASPFNGFSYSPPLRPNEQMQDEMNSIVQKMIREFDNYFLLRAEILQGLLRIFLVYLSRQYENIQLPFTLPKNISLMKRFQTLVEKNFQTMKMVTDYAEVLAVTPNYLNEIVKKVSGNPASYHIQQRIVLEAKRQAAYSNVSMKEIAYHLGFDDLAHFSKFFKNVSGINFTAFRRETVHQFSLL